MGQSAEAIFDVEMKVRAFACEVCGEAERHVQGAGFYEDRSELCKNIF